MNLNNMFETANNNSIEDKALNKFADMMIEKIKSIESDWKKPWFTEGAMFFPKNIDGRDYNGMNALMLMLHCENNGYRIPVFLTFDRVNGMNYKGGKKTGSTQAVDKEGNPLPKVSINKGEHSFPVFLTTFKVYNTETKERISYEEYLTYSNDDKSKFRVFPSLKVYNVFNIDQTNIKESRPELYAKIEKENIVEKPKVNEGEMFSFPPIDKMIKDNLWICPIKPTYGDSAYYSESKKVIVIPKKEQFKSGESFYSNLAHEMAHSTGAEEHLNRLKPAKFGSPEYAKEELVAELTSALVSQKYGMDKVVKDDSVPYLKCWLKSLKEEPSFIKTVLFDVKRAYSMISGKIDEVAGTINEKPKRASRKTK